MKTEIKFVLTEKQKDKLLRSDYGAETRQSNQTIGRYIARVCEEGIFVTKGRECFTEQKLKDLVCQRIRENPRIGRKTKDAIASHYTRYCIKFHIWKITNKML